MNNLNDLERLLITTDLPGDVLVILESWGCEVGAKMVQLGAAIEREIERDKLQFDIEYDPSLFNCKYPDFVVRHNNSNRFHDLDLKAFKTRLRDSAPHLSAINSYCKQRWHFA